jgi:PAT family beta-lactamase induction signal transducer AmpG
MSTPSNPSSPANHPWRWVPTLYFAEGIPYVAAMTLSVIVFKRFNLSNSVIAFYTSWLYLPWTIKFLWSPFIDLLKSKRWWIITTQSLIALFFCGIAFSLPTPHWFQWSMAFFWLLAFSSATHDIAADGFYMLGLDDKNQAFFVGIRNTFYRLAMISGQGLLIVLAGYLENKQPPSFASGIGSIPFAWMIVFLCLAVLFVGFSLYHSRQLPTPTLDNPRPDQTMKALFKETGRTFSSFVHKDHSALAIAFLLLFRLSESQVLKLASPFLLDSRESGGLGLTTSKVGTVYGIVGVLALIVVGILGGMAVARDGLKRWIMPMALLMCLPNIIYVFFAYVQPENLWVINAGVALEQVGYGFGFTAYTLFMIQFCKGPYQTAHYAICTGFMALGMMLPGMLAGTIQECMGYKYFFIYIMVISIIPIWMTAKIKPLISVPTNSD